MDRPSQRPVPVSGSGSRGRSPVVVALAVAAVVVVAAVLATALVPGFVAPGADGTDADADAADGPGVDDRAANASPATVGGESPTPTSTPAADVEARTTTPGPAAAPDADDDAGADSDSESAPDAGTRLRFTLEVVDATECGTTCRDVTAELSNVGDADATDVVVETTILVAGDEIWTGETDVGTVEAGETETRTERVEISLLEAAAVQSNDGYVTVETEVRWDGGRQTFSERVQTR